MLEVNTAPSATDPSFTVQPFHECHTITAGGAFRLIDRSPAHAAIDNHHTSTLHTLITKGSKFNVNHSDDDGVTPLYLALRHGHDDCVVKLTNRPNVDRSVVTASGDTLLHAAATAGKVRWVSAVLTWGGADINTPNAAGETALHVALSSQHPDVGARVTEVCVEDATRPLLPGAPVVL